MDEQKKNEVIKSLAKHTNPDKQRAAITIPDEIRNLVIDLYLTKYYDSNC